MGIETTITCDVCGVSALGEREAFPARTYCPKCEKRVDEAAEQWKAKLAEAERDRDVEKKLADGYRFESQHDRAKLEKLEAQIASRPPVVSDTLDGKIRRALEVALREHREMAATLTAAQEAASELRLKLQAATEARDNGVRMENNLVADRDGWKEAAERWERECKAAQKAGWDNLTSHCAAMDAMRRRIDVCPECLAILRADPLRHFRGCSKRKPLPADHPQAETTQALAMLSEFAESCANEANRLGNGATAYAMRQYPISSWLIGYRSKQGSQVKPPPGECKHGVKHGEPCGGCDR